MVVLILGYALSKGTKSSLLLFSPFLAFSPLVLKRKKKWRCFEPTLATAVGIGSPDLLDHPDWLYQLNK